MISEDKSPEVKKEFKDELDGEDANPEELEVSSLHRARACHR